MSHSNVMRVVVVAHVSELVELCLWATRHKSITWRFHWQREASRFLQVCQVFSGWWRCKITAGYRRCQTVWTSRLNCAAIIATSIISKTINVEEMIVKKIGHSEEIIGRWCSHWQVIRNFGKFVVKVDDFFPIFRERNVMFVVRIEDGTSSVNTRRCFATV